MSSAEVGPRSTTIRRINGKWKRIKIEEDVPNPNNYNRAWLPPDPAIVSYTYYAFDDVGEAPYNYDDKVPYGTFSYYHPRLSANIQKAMDAKFFSRIQLRDSPRNVFELVKYYARLDEKFCIVHTNVLLIFSADEEAHDEHVWIAKSMVKRPWGGWAINDALCIWKVDSAEKAGFHLQRVDMYAIIVRSLGTPESGRMPDKHRDPWDW